MSSGSRFALLVAFTIVVLAVGGMTLLGFAYLAVSEQEVPESPATHVESKHETADEEVRDPVDGQEVPDQEAEGSP